ncbi:MAG: hypothetical protein QXO70_01850 [Candidatus Pacearchaeota archaeon]
MRKTQAQVKMQGFTVHHPFCLKPEEDSYGFSRKHQLVAIADGVTRDPKNMPILPDSKKDIPGMARFFLNYPRPSPAKRAADAFVKTYLQAMTSFKEKDAQAIYEAFKEVNNQIRILNLCYNIFPDYLENDYWACVAAGTTLREQDKQKILSWGFISDCGVAVFDENGNIVFKTKNEGPNEKIDKERDKVYGSFRFPEGRKATRRIYRNNPQNPLAYGALTGEEEAMHYVRTGELELKPGNILVVYTDGLEHILISDKFAEKIKQKRFGEIRGLCRRKVKTEGSLVYCI